MEKNKLEKIDIGLLKELQEISVKNTQISGYQPSIRRLTKAIRKHSLWNKIKQDIVSTPLEDDRWKNEI